MTTYTTEPAAAGITGLTEAKGASGRAFVPEIWSDEVIATYQKSLKMSPLVRKMSMTGKKGDLIHVPRPVRGDASVKAENSAVTLINASDDDMTIKIGRHFEYSRFIEDIVEVQSLNSRRQFYTGDAGYALARQVDNDLHSAATAFRIDGAHAASGATNVVFPEAALPASYITNSCFYNNAGVPTAYAEDTIEAGDIFTDAFFRAMIQKLDDNDVPMENRVCIVPPSARKDIMGIDRYVSSDFVGGRPVETGYIGNLYGVDFYVSSNVAVIETAAENAAAGGTFDTRAALLFHKDAIVHAEQMSVRSQTQYKQEHLSTLYTSDCLYGVEVYRPESGLVLALSDG
jgi:N4-gp56 family major capsid protein